jgi:molecular chaperone DnaK (HSP70)
MEDSWLPHIFYGTRTTLGERALAKDNSTLGNVKLDKIKPAPRG